MRIMARIFCLFLLLSPASQAEIEKNAMVCDTGICLYWWPKLPQLKGWHQDKEMSFEYSANALAPDGFSFSNAEAVLYATASYKPRNPEVKTLEMFIANDQKTFKASASDISIKEVKEMTTGDGKKYRSFTFFPTSKGNWEQVAYGEEGDFYLVFTLSSRSKEGFDKTQYAYRELIAHYKTNP